MPNNNNNISNWAQVSMASMQYPSQNYFQQNGQSYYGRQGMSANASYESNNIFKIIAQKIVSNTNKHNETNENYLPYNKIYEYYR